jgi:hypothetical protein
MAGTAQRHAGRQGTNYFDIAWDWVRRVVGFWAL